MAQSATQVHPVTFVSNVRRPQHPDSDSSRPSRKIHRTSTPPKRDDANAPMPPAVPPCPSHHTPPLPNTAGRDAQVFQTVRPAPHHSYFHLSAFRIQTSFNPSPIPDVAPTIKILFIVVYVLFPLSIFGKVKGSHRIFLEVISRNSDFSNFFRMALTVSGVTPMNEAISFSGRCSFSSG